jgi:hypothetical protein
MFLCPRRVRRRHDIRGLALSVWELFRPVHTIAADVVSVLCWRVLVVVFLYDRRARAVLWTGPTPPWVPFLSVRRHASSNGVLLELAGAPTLPFADVGLMTKGKAVLLLSLASAVTGQPVTAEAVTFSPHSQPILFWGLSAAPVMIPFLAFNRFIRGTVGPLFYQPGADDGCVDLSHYGAGPLYVSRR